MARRLVVTGGSGQLGRELVPRLAKLGTVLAPGRPELDIASEAAIARLLALRPTHVIHAAAATDVERCEVEPSWAHAVNVDGTRRVVEACRLAGAWLLYVSTDYVFDGRKAAPYVETDAPAPLNAYGRSKLAGERLVQALAPRWAIVRTAWLYGHGGRNFVATVWRKLEAGGVLHVVTDQVGSPTYAVDLAEAIAQLVAHDVTGIVHLTNSGSCSRFELAQAIARQANVDAARIQPTTSDALGLRARRPAYAVLANAAWQALGFAALRPWHEALLARLRCDRP
jgi:dTDP-4-dehydrorhamnose reductase